MKKVVLASALMLTTSIFCTSCSKEEITPAKTDLTKDNGNNGSSGQNGQSTGG